MRFQDIALKGAKETEQEREDERKQKVGEDARETPRKRFGRRADRCGPPRYVEITHPADPEERKAARNTEASATRRGGRGCGCGVTTATLRSRSSCTDDLGDDSVCLGCGGPGEWVRSTGLSGGSLGLRYAGERLRGCG